MKGKAEFQKHFPDYPAKRIYLGIIPFILSLILFLTLYFLSFLIPGKLRSIPWIASFEPFFPLVVSVLTIITGFYLIESLWRLKMRYLRKYRERALQKMYLRVLTGIPCIFSLFIHNFYPPWKYLPARSELTAFLTTPLPLMLDTFYLPWIVTGCFFISAGVLTIYRTLNTFGLDYMGLVYLYYPEESEVQNHKIYSVLRHPAYFSLFLIGLGNLLVHMTLYQAADLLFFITAMSFHLHFYEEKELVSRFGDSYITYRNSVPWLYPGSLKKYFFYLMGKE